MTHTWFSEKSTQLAPYPPRSPNKGNRIGGAEPSAYLPGDTSGYSPRLSIVARSSGSIAMELGIVRPRTRIWCTIASYRSQPQARQSHRLDGCQELARLKAPV